MKARRLLFQNRIDINPREGIWWAPSTWTVPKVFGYATVALRLP